MEKEIFKYLGKAIFAFGMIFIGVLIFMFTPYFSSLTFSNAGPFGDILSGLSAAFIGSLGVSFTFLAFWVQFQANLEQRRDIRIERFESKFYEMLRLHRANVDEMNIADRVIGRKSFVQLFYELYYCYQIAEDQDKVAAREESRATRTPEDLLKFSYTLFFTGIGINSEKQFVDAFSEVDKQLWIFR